MQVAAHRLPLIWRAIAAINLISLGAVLVFRIGFTLPESEYAHRIVTYQHGFIRRALIGEIYGWFLDRVPLWLVNLESLLTLVVAIWLGWLVFRRLVQTAPLQRLAIACFLFGSPFLFKNFAGNFGKFDILGACLAMIAALLTPSLRAWLAIFALSALLLVIHHLHATLYIPTIYGVVLLRAFAAGETPARSLAIAGVSLAALAALFLFLIGFNAPNLSPAEFTAFLRSRATIPVTDDEQFMWFSTLAEEMSRTRQRLPRHIARIPVYAALFALHWPIIAFARRRVAEAKMARPAAHYVYLALLAVILAAYGATMVIAFDYARFISNAVFCAALMTQVHLLATTGPIANADDFDFADKRVIVCAAIVAVIPWVGTVVPII